MRVHSTVDLSFSTLVGSFTEILLRLSVNNTTNFDQSIGPKKSFCLGYPI